MEGAGEAEAAAGRLRHRHMGDFLPMPGPSSFPDRTYRYESPL